MSVLAKNRPDKSNLKEYKPNSAIEQLAFLIVKENPSFSTSLINVPYEGGSNWETNTFDKIVDWVSKNIEFNGTLLMTDNGTPKKDGQTIESRMEYTSDVTTTAKPSATYSVQESTSLTVTKGEDFTITAKVSMDLPFGVSAGVETSGRMSFQKNETSISSRTATVSYPIQFDVPPGKKVDYWYKFELIPMKVSSKFSISIEATIKPGVSPLILSTVFQKVAYEFNWAKIPEDQKIFEYGGVAESKIYKGKTSVSKPS